MSVNLSVKQLQHSDIVADVRDALEESGLDAARLTLEITETVMMADTDLAVQRLQELQGARRPPRDGRLRHRLLVAELPQPLPGRRPQDGPLVPARRRVAARRRASRPRSSRSARRSSSRSSPRASSCTSSGRRCATSAASIGQGFYFARPMEADTALDFLRAA